MVDYSNQILICHISSLCGYMTTDVVSIFYVTGNAPLFVWARNITLCFSHLLLFHRQSLQNVFWWSFFFSSLLLIRFCYPIRKVFIGLFFLNLGEHIVPIKQFEWLYVQVFTDSVGSVIWKTKEFNKQSWQSLCNHNSLGLSGIQEMCNIYTNQINIWH